MAKNTKSNQTKAKKSASSSSEHTVSSKTTVRRISSPTFLQNFNEQVGVKVLIAEIVGTFILTSIAILSGEGLYVGLALMVLVLSFGAVSGAHLNPAVTLAQWSIKKLPSFAVPFYWGAQFFGAFAALIVQYLYSGKTLDLAFHQMNMFDWRIFFAELIGAFIFIYVIAALSSRVHSEGVRAAGIGLGLTIGIVLGTSLLASAINSASSNSTASTSSSDLLSSQKVTSVIVNPAIALAVTEKDTASMNPYSKPASAKTAPVSRFTLETVLGPLAGAALGANLYVLLARRS
jgi:aquaporin Z